MPAPVNSNQPLEWTGHHQLSASRPRFPACHSGAALGRLKAWRQALFFCVPSMHSYPLPMQIFHADLHKPFTYWHSARQILGIAVGGRVQVTAIKRMIVFYGM